MTSTAEIGNEEQATELKRQIGVAAGEWRTSIFTNAAAFVSFLNLPPAQGAGQAFCTDRDDGRIDGFYFI